MKKINGGKTARARSKFEERSNKIKQKTGKANQLFLILSLDYPQRPWMSTTYFTLLSKAYWLIILKWFLLENATKILKMVATNILSGCNQKCIAPIDEQSMLNVWYTSMLRGDLSDCWLWPVQSTVWVGVLMFFGSSFSRVALKVQVTSFPEFKVIFTQSTPHPEQS